MFICLYWCIGMCMIYSPLEWLTRHSTKDASSFFVVLSLFISFLLIIPFLSFIIMYKPAPLERCAATSKQGTRRKHAETQRTAVFAAHAFLAQDAGDHHIPCKGTSSTRYFIFLNLKMLFYFMVMSFNIFYDMI